MLKPRTLRLDLLPAPFVVFVLPILIWALVDWRLRRIRCSFCAGGYAFWHRCRGRACLACRREIDRKLEDVMNPRGLRLEIVRYWISRVRSHR